MIPGWEPNELCNTFMQGFEVSTITFCLGGQILHNLPLQFPGRTLVQPLHPKHLCVCVCVCVCVSLRWVSTSAPCHVICTGQTFVSIIGVKFVAEWLTHHGRPSSHHTRTENIQKTETKKQETKQRENPRKNGKFNKKTERTFFENQKPRCNGIPLYKPQRYGKRIFKPECSGTLVSV